MSVVIETTVGDITIDLYTEDRPRTCLNFLKLCKVKYYNFCLFHKIERSFIAQTGDPTGTGRGGESIFAQLYGDQAKYFDAESRPKLKHRKLGTVSMVNNGSNMNGSQFFITLGEDLTYLDDVHSVFGEVTEGFDILVKLNDAICDNEGRPYQDIRITHMVILHDPYEDPSGLEVPASSPLPTKEILSSNYVGADEEIDDTKGRSIEEIEEEIKDKEAKARATILEMVGDIPDAEVKPPENVLFVCKLNPVTTSEDLEIIFSRFGPILSCEVIKDKKTGESLQYAFIEFEKEEDCENAYFKMDNVLIDDRRIHVDFSQSVAKLKFDERNKKNSKKPADRDRLVLKSKSSKQDDYEMVFESDDDNSRMHPKDNKQYPRHSSKQIEKSSDLQRQSSSHSRKKKDRSHSPQSYRASHASKHGRSRSPRNYSSKSYTAKHQSRSRSPPKHSSDHSSKQKPRSPSFGKRSSNHHKHKSKSEDFASSSHHLPKHGSSRSPNKQPFKHSPKQRTGFESPRRQLSSHSSKHEKGSHSSKKHVSKQDSSSPSPQECHSRHRSMSSSPKRHSKSGSSKSKHLSDSRSYHHKHKRRSSSSSPDVKKHKSSKKAKKSHRH